MIVLVRSNHNVQDNQQHFKQIQAFISIGVITIIRIAWLLRKDIFLASSKPTAINQLDLEIPIEHFGMQSRSIFDGK